MYAEGDVVGGRYRLVRRIGEGGMATVWEAEHLILHSAVAVKFLQTSGRKIPELTQRFMEEARVAASVRHRNVIEITDFGITKEQVPYMVMERLVGESLADRMNAGPLDVFEATRIVSLLLRGLGVVHDAGIVHRDLKPENVFLVRDPDGEYPKLIDFGVSRRVGLAPSDLSLEGTLVGTPDYMSPEQARASRDLDLRTDIYSVGVILYEALSGRLPFVADDLGTLIAKIETEVAPPVDALRPDVPAEIASVIHRAMSKEREARFEDARAMRRALLDACGGFSSLHSEPILTSISEIPPPLENRPEEKGAEIPRRPTTVGSRVRSSWMTASILASLVIAAALGLVAQRRFAIAAAEDEIEVEAVVWTPTTPPPPLSSFEIQDDLEASRATVALLFSGLPEGTTIFVEEIPLEDLKVILPANDATYRLEARNEAGETIWRDDHPGHVDGEYLVWTMNEDVFPESPSGEVPIVDEAPE